MTDFGTLGEIVKAARQNLSQNVWDYLSGGAESEASVNRNRHALDSIAFRPRILRNVAEIDASTSFLGNHLRIPVILAPVGSLDALDPGGSVTVAKAAQAFGSMHLLSSWVRPGFEEVGKAATCPKGYQLTGRGDDGAIRETIQKVKDHGFTCCFFTIDSNGYYGRRERDMIKHYVPLGRARNAGKAIPARTEAEPILSWDRLKRIREESDFPLVMKGIACGEDAALAVEAGADAVYVSNHGGRQLDHGPGALELLPEVVEAVAGRVEVVIDGGFVRGTDVVKAIAMGATAVAMGKM